MQDQWASLSTDGRLGHLLIHMQLETRAPGGGGGGVLVSSYCCSTYRVADPFSSLGTFSSSSIGGPVFHPIADCEHPLLCLLGPGIVSQETAISGSFQQNLPMLSQKSPIPSPPLPYPPTPTSWPWRSPVLRHIKFARPMGLSFH